MATQGTRTSPASVDCSLNILRLLACRATSSSRWVRSAPSGASGARERLRRHQVRGGRLLRVAAPGLRERGRREVRVPLGHAMLDGRRCELVGACFRRSSSSRHVPAERPVRALPPPTAEPEAKVVSFPTVAQSFPTVARSAPWPTAAAHRAADGASEGDAGGTPGGRHDRCGGQRMRGGPRHRRRLLHLLDAILRVHYGERLDSGTSMTDALKTLGAATRLALKGGDCVTVETARTTRRSSSPPRAPRTRARVRRLPRGDSTGGAKVVSTDAYNGFMVNANYVMVDGFDLEDTSTGSAFTAGTNTLSSGKVIVYHHIAAVRNIAHDSGGAGLSALHSDYVRFEGNTVYDNSSRSDYGDSGIDLGDAGIRHAAWFHSSSATTSRTRTWSRTSPPISRPTARGSSSTPSITPTPPTGRRPTRKSPRRE